MKKRVLVCLAVVTVLASSFIGCGKKVDCEICGEEKSGKTYELVGEDCDICNDCYKENKDAIKILEDCDDEDDLYDLDEDDIETVLELVGNIDID